MLGDYMFCCNMATKMKHAVMKYRVTGYNYIQNTFVNP